MKHAGYWLKLYFLKPLWPFKQMRERGNHYVCPYLMHVQWWIWRLWKRNLYWSDGMLCQRYPKGHGGQVRDWWPEWLVTLECCWHNRSFWSFRTWWRYRVWKKLQAGSAQ